MTTGFEDNLRLYLGPRRCAAMIEVITIGAGTFDDTKRDSIARVT
jgi:hypothetical protein